MRSQDLTDSRIAQIDEGVDWLTAGLIKQMFDMAESQPDPHGNNTPTVVLVGEKELGVTKVRARALAKSLVNARGYVVRGLGHAWPLQEPRLFRRAIRAWMTDAELGDEFISLSR